MLSFASQTQTPPAPKPPRSNIGAVVTRLLAKLRPFVSTPIRIALSCAFAAAFLLLTTLHLTAQAEKTEVNMNNSDTTGNTATSSADEKRDAAAANNREALSGTQSAPTSSGQSATAPTANDNQTDIRINGTQIPANQDGNIDTAWRSNDGNTQVEVQVNNSGDQSSSHSSSTSSTHIEVNSQVVTGNDGSERNARHPR